MLRAYKKEDIKALQDLFRETLTRSNCWDYSPEQLAVWAKGAALESHWQERLSRGITLLAVDENNLLQGFGMLTKDGLIDFLFVHPDCQRKGIGLLILDELENQARMLEFLSIESNVSITAKKFFESNGYQVLAKQKNYREGIELENFRMKKILSIQ